MQDSNRCIVTKFILVFLLLEPEVSIIFPALHFLPVAKTKTEGLTKRDAGFDDESWAFL